MDCCARTFVGIAAALAAFGCTTIVPRSARLGHDLVTEHDERCAAAKVCQAASDASCISLAAQTLMSAGLPAPTQTCLIEALVVRCESGGREAVAEIATWYAASRREFAAGRTAIIHALSRCKSADGVLAVSSAEQQDLVQAAVLAGVAPALVGGAEERLRWTRQVASLPPPRSLAEAAEARARGEKESADRMWAERSAAAAKEEQRQAEERNEQRRQEGLAALAAAFTALEAGNLLEARAQLSKAEAVGAVDTRLSARIDAEAAAAAKKRISVAWTALRHGDVDAAADAATAARALGLVDGNLNAALDKLRERKRAEDERLAAEEEKRQGLLEARARWIADRRCAAGKASCKRAEQACGKTFRVLVGDLGDTDFGKSIGGRVQALNAGMRKVGPSRSKKESWAQDVPPLVRLLRENRSDFVAYCAAQMGKIIAPCEPYEFGTQAYALCIQERQAEFACFADRGPWRYLTNLKQGALNEDQSNLAMLMIAVADARPYCSDVD